MNTEPIKDNVSEFRPDDESVSRLLSAMKRVEAPKDFDFKVRARIAAGRRAERPAIGIPAAIRYALPLVVLVLIGAYFGFNAIYSNKNINVPEVADSKPPVVVPQLAPASNEAVVVPVGSAVPSNQVIDDRAVVKKTEFPNNAVVDTTPKKSTATNRPAGESYVEGSRQPTILYPRGVNPNSAPPANAKAMDRMTQVPASEVLSMFGVSGTLGEGGWKVESVGPDTLAGRSGVRAGDVIEAINDQALTDKMTFKGKFNGKSLRVRRGAVTIQITLKN